MFKLCVFAGTTEGRRLLELLSRQQAKIYACVATEYGETLLPESDNITVLTGRMTESEMGELFCCERFDLVIDATHPYADKATESIFAACRASETEYLRLLRESSAKSGGISYAESIGEAVKLLNLTSGNILLTTGSKQLSDFKAVNGFSDRVYVRVLPISESLACCEKAGIAPSHIFAAQGPFSEEMNLALINAVSAEWLVTKDGGSIGGFDQKLSAAKKAGIKLLVIGRPPQREGYGFSDTIALIKERFGFFEAVSVDIIGASTGSREQMTAEALAAVYSADCIIGAKRLLDEWRDSKKELFESVSPEKTAKFIGDNRQYSRFAVLMSGDSGFFSGTKRLLPLLSKYETRVFAGISSLSFLCSKIKTSYEDIVPVSLHGRDDDIALSARENRRVFALLDGKNDAASVCRRLTEAGLGGIRVTVAQRLGCSDEKITVSTADKLCKADFSPLSVILTENDAADRSFAFGLPDDAFSRGEGERGIIPMTKSEIRAVCLSKLRLTEHSVCWDIGAGTGSVSVEMARAARKGAVYAIERDKAAIELIKKNKERFSLDNITLISGSAPDICRELPAPTHVFIGGSGGNMRELISLLLNKTPDVRIVAAAVSLQTVSELTDCMNSLPFMKTEVTALSVSRGRRAGGYDLMTAQNTVYIFTLQGGEKKP